MTYNDRNPYIIQIGEHFTKSFCYQVFYSDSINNIPGFYKYDLGAISNVLQTTTPGSPAYRDEMGKFSRGFFHFYVYKDYNKEMITVVDQISVASFYYDDELKPQEWTVLDDTMTILGYPCQKAICSFRGRDWEAWFTPDIPISEGPWKFYGLPGLIAKLEDTESHYCFEMIGFEKVNEPIHTYIDYYFRKMDRLSFLKLKMSNLNNELVAIDYAKIGISFSGQVKHYDHIERDYKYSQ